MTAILVEMYETGAITANSLVMQSLHKIDPTNPGLVLGPLPRDILLRVRDFADLYESGQMVTNHPFLLPAQDQVDAARRWIAQALGNSPAAESADEGTAEKNGGDTTSERRFDRVR